MARKKHQPAEIIDKLQKVERLMAEGQKLDIAVTQIEVSVQTYYRWKRQYGSMKKPEAKRLKDLERENARLKKLVADLSIEKDILKEVIEGKF